MLRMQCLRTAIVGFTLIVVTLASRDRLLAAPSESVLWSFANSFGTGDGNSPEAGLIEVSGRLYGTTYSGGAIGGCIFGGCGAVFQLTPPAPGQTAWTESLLWSFGGAGDGQSPGAGLIEMGGKLYGTTGGGGANCSPYSCGTVFELTPPTPGQTAWSERVVWNFGGAGDGSGPNGLIHVGRNLFGTTGGGGAADDGTVFELTPPMAGQKAWNERVLWSFGTVSGDGIAPFTGLTEVGGKLYGVTFFGGTSSGGVAFELTPPRSGQMAWSETVIWSFTDFSAPGGGLIEAGGKLYGTTVSGGTKGEGSVFELTPSAPGETQWSEQLLHSFSFGSKSDGQEPMAGLTEVDHTLYGTTYLGGANSQGTVFQLTPPGTGQTQWNESLVWSFGGADDGAVPLAGLIKVGGSLYGTTSGGGANGSGTVFEVTP